MPCLLIGLELYAFCILHAYNKTALRLSLRANPTNNKMHISLFIGLGLSESLNVLLFYIHNMQNAFNPNPTYYNTI
jgi:hypothetical protein